MSLKLYPLLAIFYIKRLTIALGKRLKNDTEPPLVIIELQVGLRQLIDGCCLVPELISSLDDNECGAGDQIKRFEHSIDGSL